MIFDYLYNFPNATSPDQILVQTESTMSALVPMFLLFVFGVIFLGSIQRQKSKTGQVDYPFTATIAMLGTLLVSAFMTVISGLISLGWLIIVFVLSLLCALWLLMDRKFFEGTAV